MAGVVSFVKAILSLGYAAIARPGRHGAIHARINGFTRFNRNTRLGRNFNTNGLVIFGQGKVTVGNNFHSGSGVRIYTSSHNYDGSMVPYDRTLRHYSVVIGDQVWLGSNVTIVGNVTIGEGAVVQVGSVVSSDIPRLAIAGGNPARAFKQRDAEVYEHNKAAKRFH